MPVSQLTEFLDQNNVKYVTITHSTAYTAQEIAHSAHVPGEELAKTVIVKLDGKMVMAVVPAPARVNLDRLREISGASKAELAGESEFRDLFPGCDVGAEPPFGNLYELDVYVDSSLTEDETIVFNAGSHTELLQLAYRDYENLVKPRIVDFASES